MSEVHVQVLYPQSDRFDWTYYINEHMRMVGEEMDILYWTVAEGIDAAVPPSYQAVATLVFASRDKWLSSIASVGPKLTADIPNYTDAAPTLLVTEIRGGGKKA